jgi:hypothetical protein
MKMQFESSKQEREFDHFAAEWLQRYRHPGTADLAKVMERAAEIGGLPCVSLFERAWRELFSEGAVAMVTEKLVEPQVEKPEVLTAEAYKKIPASRVTRLYMTDRSFKAQVDSLISRRLI